MLNSLEETTAKHQFAVYRRNLRVVFKENLLHLSASVELHVNIRVKILGSFSLERSTAEASIHTQKKHSNCIVFRRQLLVQIYTPPTIWITSSSMMPALKGQGLNDIHRINEQNLVQE